MPCFVRRRQGGRGREKVSQGAQHDPEFLQAVQGGGDRRPARCATLLPLTKDQEQDAGQYIGYTSAGVDLRMLKNVLCENFGVVYSPSGLRAKAHSMSMSHKRPQPAFHEGRSPGGRCMVQRDGRLAGRAENGRV